MILAMCISSWSCCIASFSSFGFPSSLGAMMKKPLLTFAYLESSLMLFSPAKILFNSPWGAPAVMVTKKDGTMRFCIDYRYLNSVTVKDSFPIPKIDMLLDKLKDAHYFSTLDLRSGFHQIPMDNNSIPLTGFVTPSGAYAFNVMPFGLCNAPSFSTRGKTSYINDMRMKFKEISDQLASLNQVDIDSFRQYQTSLKLYFDTPWECS